jgi:hypothetical protein
MGHAVPSGSIVNRKRFVLRLGSPSGSCSCASAAKGRRPTGKRLPQGTPRRNPDPGTRSRRPAVGASGTGWVATPVTAGRRGRSWAAATKGRHHAPATPAGPGTRRRRREGRVRRGRGIGVGTGRIAPPRAGRRDRGRRSWRRIAPCSRNTAGMRDDGGGWGPGVRAFHGDGHLRESRICRARSERDRPRRQRRRPPVGGRGGRSAPRLRRRLLPRLHQRPHGRRRPPGGVRRGCDRRLRRTRPAGPAQTREAPLPDVLLDISSCRATSFGHPTTFSGSTTSPAASGGRASSSIHLAS